MKRSQYDIDEVTGCWNWSGARHPSGYGRLKVGGKQLYAHRYMYEKVRGRIPDGRVIDHLCRNRSCVNPDHLEVVTQTENMRRGLVAKLTLEQVNEIRAQAGKVKQSELGATYCGSQLTISRILRRQNWRD